MRISVKIGLLATAFALPACAPNAGDVATTQVADTFVEGSGPALWKVADEDTTIYLFGTVHALPADMDWKTPVVANALAEAGSLVTEIDMTPAKLAEVGPMMVQRASLPQGQTLRSLMDDEQRASYEAGLSRLGIPTTALDNFEPWFAAITVAQVMMQKAGYTPESGVEQVLENAVGEGTRRVALETFEYQIDMFDTLPMDKQVEYLIASVEDSEEGQQLLQQIVDEWAVGDVDDVGALLARGFAETPELAERLLYVRNANWAEWIDMRLDTPGTAFMAVGAGHLAGDRSVQDYLEERGISFQRVQ